MSEPITTPSSDPVQPGSSSAPPTSSAPAAPPTPAPLGLLARYWWVAGLAIAAVVAILAANFASGDPDGLDSVAIQKGFEEAGKDAGFQVLPDYTIPGFDGTISTVIAGLVGIAVVFVLVFLLGRLLARRRRDAAV